MEGEIRLSPRQQEVFRVLSDWNGGVEHWWYLSHIAEREKMDHRALRNVARALARKGLVEIVQLFDEDTGLTAGSTYRLTKAAREAAQQVEVQQ